MELPTEYKELYKHWDNHTKEVKQDIDNDIQLPKDLEYLMTERMRIWEKKYNKDTLPFTADSILQKYRFCNIYRELDRQTIEIHKSLKTLEKDFPLWLLNLSFHRFICRPTIVKEIGLLSFDPVNNNKVYKNLLTIQKPKFGNAYVFPISVIQKSAYPTREEFFCLYLPKAIPSVAATLETFNNVTVNEALKTLLPVFGFNMRFHWTEILIDVAYQYPERIDLFKDFYVGPGALPTAKLLKPDFEPSETIDQCVSLQPKGFPYLEYNGKRVLLSAENWEGIFCEYRKYSNLKSGKGRIRRFLS